MKSQSQFFTLFILSFLLTNCGNAPKKESENKAEQQAATEAVSPKETPTPPETYLYLVTMDKFRLRDQPNQQGKVVHQFAAGEFVEGTGKASEKQQIEINGMGYDDPWFEVVSTTPEQQRGWLYGAGVLRVYAGARTVSPDLGKLTQFSMALKKLDPKKVDSGKAAWQFVRANFAESKGTLADAAFLMLDNFLNKVQFGGKFPDFEKAIQPKEADYDAIWKGTFDLSKTAATRQIEEAGFTLATTEGSIFAVPDMKKMEQFFVQKVTPPMKKYLEQTTREDLEVESSDGGLVIGLDELASRAVFWEQFNQQHPYFVASEQTQNFEKWKRWSLLCGMDNTPSFDYETKKPTEEFTKIWSEVQTKYAGTKLARKAKELTDLIASEGGLVTEKVRKWQEAVAEEATK